MGLGIVTPPSLVAESILHSSLRHTITVKSNYSKTHIKTLIENKLQYFGLKSLKYSKMDTYKTTCYHKPEDGILIYPLICVCVCVCTHIDNCERKKKML
jgi:hypothetical protein